MSTLRCPICHKSFESTESEALPFCSSRCRQVDLNRWLGEEYSMPVEPEVDEDELPHESDN